MVVIVVSVVESQESGGGDDVTATAWLVGQQLPHFRTVPHFCASLWRRCHLSRNLSDSWEWNEVRNQSHILFGNVSAVVPILPPSGSLSTSFPVAPCRMGPWSLLSEIKCYYWVQRSTHKHPTSTFMQALTQTYVSKSIFQFLVKLFFWFPCWGCTKKQWHLYLIRLQHAPQLNGIISFSSGCL